MLRRIVRLAVPTLADWCTVHLRGSDGRMHAVEAAHSDPGKDALAREVLRRYRPGPQSPQGIHNVVESGKPRLIPKLTKRLIEVIAHDATHLAALHELALRSAMVVPLTARRQKLGAITFISSHPFRRYGPADLQLAEQLASQAALAIDNARLFADAERARLTAQDAADRLRILSDAGNLLMASSLDYDAALRSLAEFVVSRIADICTTYRLEADGTARPVGVAHSQGDKSNLVQKLLALRPPRLEDESGIGSIMRTGTAMLVENISDSLLQQNTNDSVDLEFLRSLRLRSSVVVPLRARGRTLGAMALATTADSGRPLRQRDLELAQELGVRVAPVLDNARLYSEAQQEIEARQDLMAVVSHDLRNPLNTIQMAATILATGEAGADQRQRQYEVITRTIRQMDSLISDILDVSRLEAGKLVLNAQPIDVAALLDEAAGLLRDQAEHKQLSLLLDPPLDACRVQADHSRIQQVLANLIGNAIKFTAPGGRIELAARHSGEFVTFCVSDNGAGIRPEHVPRLFQRFWQAERGSGGSGLGLFIARGIIEAHGGRIWVDSTLGQGTELRFTIPVAP